MTKKQQARCELLFLLKAARLHIRLFRKQWDAFIAEVEKEKLKAEKFKEAA